MGPEWEHMKAQNYRRATSSERVLVLKETLRCDPLLGLHLTGEVTFVDSVRVCDNRHLVIEL
jgi:hypothetical protein